MSEPTFKELERSGWRDKAVSYDDWAAKITAQAIDPYWMLSVPTSLA